MQLGQNIEKNLVPKNNLDKIKNETKKDLNNLKKQTETKNNKNYEIISNESSLEIKFKEKTGTEHSINIIVDNELNRKFSHSTEGLISDGDLNFEKIKESGDKNIDNLRKVLNLYGIKIKDEDIIKISLFMKNLENKKVKELENL